jgi:multiple sugar transport system permease protein
MAVVTSPPGATQAPPPARRPHASRSPWFHVVMVPFTILWLAPIVFVVLIALRNFDDIATRGLGALPGSLSLDGFAGALADGRVGRALVNSAIVTVFAVAASLALASAAAYALSRYRIPFRRTLLLIMLAGNLLPPQILLIPVSRIAQDLGIYDTLFALVIVQVGFGLGFYTFVLHGFMRALPTEVFEAALLDGAGSGRTFWSIVLPLCRPALITSAIFTFIWSWNDFIGPLLYLNEPDKYTVSMGLKLFIDQDSVADYGGMVAMSLVALLPVLLFFLAFQRYLVEGASTSGLKG